MPPVTRNARMLALPTALALASSAAAAPSPVAVRRSPFAVRQAGYKALGTAFNRVNDAIRAGTPSTPTVAAAARQIVGAARAQYQWFPVGSGAQGGVRTAARPDIWSRPAEFRAAQDDLLRQAGLFERALRGGDPAMVRDEARKLGATCKSCHDVFRSADG